MSILKITLLGVSLVLTMVVYVEYVFRFLIEIRNVSWIMGFLKKYSDGGGYQMGANNFENILRGRTQNEGFCL